MHQLPFISPEATVVVDVMAHEEAVETESNSVHTEHLLLAIMTTPTFGIVLSVLGRGMDVTHAHRVLKSGLTRKPLSKLASRRLRNADDLNRVVKIAQEKARDTGAECVEIEHLLFGIAACATGYGGYLLTEKLGIGPNALGEVIRELHREVSAA